MTSFSLVDWVSLPEELWLNQILAYLPTATLSRLALVSKKLSRLATDPSLWASKQVVIDKEKMIRERPFLIFLTIPRFTKMKKLDLSGQVLPLEFAEALFRYLNSSSCQITAINLSNVKVSGGCCFYFDIGNDLPRDDHDNSNFIHHSFNFVNDTRSTIADKFSFMMISDRQRELNENLVGRAIAKLDESKLENFVNAKQDPQASSRYVSAILHKIKSTLHHQSIDFTFLDFSKVSPALFAESIASLRRAKFLQCEGLTSEHSTALFTFIAKQKSVSLTSLILIDVPLPENSPEELGLSISKLKHLHLSGGNFLKRDQARAILQAVPKSNLESLDIGPTFPDGLPIDMIGAAVLHLNPGKISTINNILSRLSQWYGDVLPWGRRAFAEKKEIWHLLQGNDVFFWYMNEHEE